MSTATTTRNATTTRAKTIGATTSIAATLRAVKPPIRIDENGTVRIGKTRVTLDTFVYFLNCGNSPEELVQQFPTISLSDAYGAAAYYLTNRAVVDDYIAAREREAEPIIARIKAEFNASDLGKRLLALKASSKA